MAQAPKTDSKAKKSSTKSDSQEVLDAVDKSAPKETAPKEPKDTKAAPAASAKTADASAAKADSAKKDAEKSDGGNAFMNFIYKHPWICLFVFYIILTALVKVWGWATIVFLLIPIVCFGRIWMLSRDTDAPLATDDHKRVEWWAKVGLISSVFGLASALILNWLGILTIFR